jgi:threonylcarbamoyladenosine tRNA methylthiotransferase MtaB
VTSFSIQTFGCRVNQAEAFLWADEFQKHGLKYEEDFRQSDLVIVNSCTLTSRADSDLKGFIRRAASLNPRAKLIVTGCYAERAAEEVRKIPQVWLVFSNKEKEELPRRILSLFGRGSRESALPFRSRALVKIQDGCNFRCTFCIIPSVRGKSRSLEKSRILAQVKEFKGQGFKEVVLTGVHLCSYGADLQPRSSLLELLQEVEALDGVPRLRLSSLDPRFLEFRLLNHLTSSQRICPHFHLSLQSGSDRILERMGRKIRVEDYKIILSQLREESPQASLGADIIVGFPGESEDDFEQSYSFLEQSPLTYFHVFAYSPRPGTEASSWDQVEDRTKTKRGALLRELSRKKNLRFRQLFVGKDCEAIVIKKEKKKTEVLTSNYFKVYVPSCPYDKREEVRVRVKKADRYLTEGEVVNLIES